MSIKKELLNELTEKQLKKLAESKGISFELSKVQKKFYEDWNEKEKIIDIMNDHQNLTLGDIEQFIKKS